MAAVLRVKRRNDEEPLDALVLAYKRRKTDDNVPFTTVVKFAGTVSNQDENVVEHIVKTLNKDELKENFKQHPVDVINKIREKTKQASVENRYKVVNCFRSLDTSNVDLEDKVMTVIDVEDSVSCATKQDSELEESNNYVYDLYYAQTRDDLSHIDDLVSVHTLDQEFVFDQYRDNTSYSNVYESDDSNSESNWRNDYPDSDHSHNNLKDNGVNFDCSDDSIDEDDMRRAVMNIKLDDEESDLSSEDDFVYAVDEDDVDRYGYKYAKYKARIKKVFGEGDSDSNSDNDDSDKDSDSNSSEYSGVCISEEKEDDND